MTTTPRGGFSDEDLERLKEYIGEDRADETLMTTNGIIWAILARLEAAELCVEDCLSDENCCQAWPIDGPSHAETWRKSRGE